jgi:hypothetical protein
MERIETNGAAEIRFNPLHSLALQPSGIRPFFVSFVDQKNGASLPEAPFQEWLR